MGWIRFRGRRIEERKRRGRFGEERMREFGDLGLYKNGCKTVYPTPGRPAQTESNLGFSRSTGYGLRSFFCIPDYLGPPPSRPGL